MSTETLTLKVPGPLYHHLKEHAERAHRSVEEETLEVLATALPLEDALPPDLSEAVESLELLDDSALWEAARSRLAHASAVRLEALHHKRQREGLTDAETEELAGLVRQYERHMLIRAQAAALLRQRGHDVDELVRP